MALASMVWGSLSDRFGPRPVVLIGSVILAASLALASRATSLVAVPAHLRPARRRRDGRDLRADDGLRHRLVRHASQPCRVARLGRHGHGADDHVALGGVARLHPRLADLAADHRRPGRRADDPGGAPGPPPAGARQADAPAPRRRTSRNPPCRSAQAMRSPQFIILLLTNFFCCATHSGPIFHTVSYAISCGIPMIAAVSIYSVEGLAGMGGRIAFGILGDRFGAKRVLVVGPAAAGVRRAGLCLRARAWRVLRRGGAVRLHLCRRHAALRRARARELPAADDGHRHRRHGDGRAASAWRPARWPAA